VTVAVGVTVGVCEGARVGVLVEVGVAVGEGLGGRGWVGTREGIMPCVTRATSVAVVVGATGAVQAAMTKPRMKMAGMTSQPISFEPRVDLVVIRLITTGYPQSSRWKAPAR